MTKGYCKVIADSRLKLERDTAFALPWIVREGKTQTCTNLTGAGIVFSFFILYLLRLWLLVSSKLLEW